MGIKFDSKRNIFHLFIKDHFSYYIHINKLNYLIHLYSGAYIDDISKERCSERYIERYSFLENGKERMDEEYYFSLFSSLFECGSYGKGDKRVPYTLISNENNGIDITNFKYLSFKILNKLDIDYDLPFPHIDSKIDILKIETKDEYREIYLNLYYIVLEKYKVFLRFSSLINNEEKYIKVKKLSSLELDLNNSNYKILALKGSWSDDREIEYIPLNHSITKISDNHGARGFSFNPSLALLNNESNEDNGEVYGFSFIYSGDFEYEFNVDQIDQTRILVGFNEENFEWILNKGEILNTPLTLLAYSNNGLNGISHIFHDFINNCILPKDKFKDKTRPILINSWEAFYFDFNSEKIIDFIKRAKDVGIELVCIDDGWFLKRDNDSTSLGDREVNKDKIDLKKIIEYANSLGMKIGLWFEPEMISPLSNLYKNHKEFALVPKEIDNPTLSRHQLVLDLVNKDVRDYIFNSISKILDEYKIEYVKWDFNRFLTEGYSNSLDALHKKETYHRFILGVYDLLSRFKKRYPNILFETCASGGGRFDIGMLLYSDQIWCSDETDISLRNYINYATNIFYPLKAIGTHVSNRVCGTIQDKLCLAFFGTYGFELDLSKLNDNDLNTIKSFNDIYKKWHHIVENGDYYSLINPFISNYNSFMVVTKDKKEAALFLITNKKEATKSRYIKLKGLDENKYYFNSLNNEIYKGSFYLNLGINLSVPLEVFKSALIILKEVNSIIAKPYKKFKQKDGKTTNVN